VWGGKAVGMASSTAHKWLVRAGVIKKDDK